MKAVIVRDVELVASKSGVEVGEVAELRNRMPLMQLENGEVVEANDCHRFVALGTEGEARYDSVRNLWVFVSEDDLQAAMDAGEAEGEYVGEHTEDISYKFEESDG